MTHYILAIFCLDFFKKNPGVNCETIGFISNNILYV